MIESDNFAYWLSIHGKPSFSFNQAITFTEIAPQTTDANLISVLFYAGDEMALKALKELKARFQDELHSLEEANRDRSMSYSGANNADHWN